MAQISTAHSLTPDFCQGIVTLVNAALRVFVFACELHSIGTFEVIVVGGEGVHVGIVITGGICNRLLAPMPFVVVRNGVDAIGARLNPLPLRGSGVNVFDADCDCIFVAVGGVRTGKLNSCPDETPLAAGVKIRVVCCCVSIAVVVPLSFC